MTILHYLPGLPPVRDGGLIKYALDLAQGQKEAGHDVLLLMPGKLSGLSKKRTRIVTQSYRNLECDLIINPLPVTEGRSIDRTDFLYEYGAFDVYDEFLRRKAPEIIHVHSLMGLHLAFMHAAEALSIPTVFTTHDYYGLCPKVNLFKNGRICREKDWNTCDSCMGQTVSVKAIKFQHSNLYRVAKSNRFIRWLEYSQKLLPYKIYIKKFLNKHRNAENNLSEKKQNTEEINKGRAVEYETQRKYFRQIFNSITYFHYNSTQSKQIFESYLGNIRGDIISITNKGIKDNRRIKSFSGKLKIGYLAHGRAFKGYGFLKETLDKMYQMGMTEFECHVYFNTQDINYPYICHHEPYDETEKEKVFRNMDVLAVPSLWNETFGMVVLEALSFGVPVIVSSHVGAKELLEEKHGMGMVIDIDQNKDGLRDALEQIYRDRNLLAQMNRAICEWNHEWDFEGHVAEILNLYAQLC